MQLSQGVIEVFHISNDDCINATIILKHEAFHTRASSVTFNRRKAIVAVEIGCILVCRKKHKKRGKRPKETTNLKFRPEQE